MRYPSSRLSLEACDAASQMCFCVHFWSVLNADRTNPLNMEILANAASSTDSFSPRTDDELRALRCVNCVFNISNTLTRRLRTWRDVAVLSSDVPNTSFTIVLTIFFVFKNCEISFVANGLSLSIRNDFTCLWIELFTSAPLTEDNATRLNKRIDVNENFIFEMCAVWKANKSKRIYSNGKLILLKSIRKVWSMMIGLIC